MGWQLVLLASSFEPISLNKMRQIRYPSQEQLNLNLMVKPCNKNGISASNVSSISLSQERMQGLLFSQDFWPSV